MMGLGGEGGVNQDGAGDSGSPEHRWVGRNGGGTPELWDSDRRQLRQAFLVALGQGFHVCPRCNVTVEAQCSPDSE